MFIPERLTSIQPFHVMSLLAEARRMESEGRSVIHLEVGEPDFPTPQPVIDSAIQAMAEQNIGYSPAGGLPELRAAVANYYQEIGVHVSPDRIFITPGASGAIQLAVCATSDHNQNLLLTSPGYTCNQHIATAMGVNTRVCQLSQLDGYQPVAANLLLAADKNTSALLLASPQNPTGACIPDDHLNEIIRASRQNGWQLIMDEIYSDLVYNRKVSSVLQKAPDSWVVHSFSKIFQMTGWRLGWLVVPDGYQTLINNLAQNLYLCAPTIAQRAALSCFTPEVSKIISGRRLELDERRKYLLGALPELGFKLAAEANGAFYLYLDASSFTDNSLEFCLKLLRETGVAIAPGIDFDTRQGADKVRIAYTQPVETLKEAVNRLAEYLNK